MSLRLGDTAPDFTQESTEGPIHFHDWIGNSWAVLFSHPKDFTPVCTTELGAVARLKPEFEKRNVKVIGLSVDPLSDHRGWAGDIAETQGTPFSLSRTSRGNAFRGNAARRPPGDFLLLAQDHDGVVVVHLVAVPAVGGGVRLDRQALALVGPREILPAPSLTRPVERMQERFAVAFANFVDGCDVRVI